MALYIKGRFVGRQPILVFESQLLLNITDFFLSSCSTFLEGKKDDENPERVVDGTVPPVLCLCLRHLQDGANLQEADLQGLLQPRHRRRQYRLSRLVALNFIINPSLSLMANKVTTSLHNWLILATQQSRDSVAFLACFLH